MVPGVVADLEAPAVELGDLDTPGYAWSVVIRPGVAYVANGSEGVRIEGYGRLVEEVRRAAPWASGGPGAVRWRRVMSTRRLEHLELGDVDAAVTFLRDSKGIDHIAVVGHSAGAEQAAE